MLKQQLNLPKATWRQLKRELRQTDPASCAAAVGGLLTVPRFATYDVRLETLAHLAVAYARGRRPLSSRRALHWLDGILADSTAFSMEEPPEDVFVSNVHTPSGNCRLFDGQWDSAHAYLQQLLDCVPRQPDSRSSEAIAEPIRQLLRLSDAIAERSGLPRWTPPSDPSLSRTFSSLPNLESLGRRVSFSRDDLRSLNIQPTVLDAFVLPREDWSATQTARIVESDLTRRPLLRIDDTIICVLPSTISISARHYVLAAAAQLGCLDELAARLRTLQETLLFRDITPQLGTVDRAPIEVEPVSPDRHHGTVAVWKLDDVTAVAVTLLHDNLRDVLEKGFDSVMALSPEVWHVLLQRIETLSQQHDIVFACVVVGGLGRHVLLDVSQPSQSTFVPVINLYDLHVFASLEDASFLRLLKLTQHEDVLRAQGVTIVNMSGFLNLFAYWESRGYRLVPDNMHLPQWNTPLQIPHNCFRDLRIRERTNADHHVVRAPMETDDLVIVERLEPHATCPSDARRPVYASREALLAGQLAGVVEGSTVTVWVLVRGVGLPGPARDQAYRIWYALLKWLDRAQAWLPSQTAEMRPFVVYVELEEPDLWAQELFDGPSLEAAAPRARRNGTILTLRVPPGFVQLLDRSDNDAERALLESVIGCLLSSAGRLSHDVEARAAEIVRRVMRGRDAREIHLLRSRGPTDHLPNPRGPLPRLLQPEDVSFTRLGLGWQCLPAKPTGRVVRREAAQKLLHDCVDALWRSIRRQLRTLDRRDVISLSMDNIEAMWRDRRQWRATARAVLALAPDEDNALGIVATREMQRTIAAVSFRVLSEMAAATAKPAGGQSPSWAQLDRLAARVGQIIELASYSDAIRGNLADSEVQVTPAGIIVVDRGYIDGLMSPFFRRRHDHDYLHDAETYEKHRGSLKDDEEVTWLTEPFRVAFETEFGISIDSLLQVVGGLIDIAGTEGSLVVALPTIVLRERVAEIRDLSPCEVAKVLQFLTLPSRNRWDSAPDGYEKKDWFPWRFRRRLSIAMTPLVALGTELRDDVVFGANQLVTSLSYRLDGLVGGYFPAEHFSSDVMRRYVGETRHREGHAFAENVSELLRQLGWLTDVGVEMSSLGAPEELGDIDVLAWHHTTPQVLIIECKSLIPRGNTYELVEELLAFRGEATDRLGRHLSRAQWLTDNRPSLDRYVSDERAGPTLTPLFVTNRDVPMRYIDTLPISPDAFCPLDQLRELVERMAAAAQ